MSAQEFKDVEDVRSAMNKLKQDKETSNLVGMGVITFLASAIEKLAEEIEQLKKK